MSSGLLTKFIRRSGTEETFGDFPDRFKDFEQSRICILPIAYDKTSTYLKGADRGPEALLRASSALENYCIRTGSEVFREGIHTLQTYCSEEDPEGLAVSIHELVSELFAAKKFPVILGGEHSVSIGCFSAAALAYEDISILQLDAHADTRDSYLGSTHNHACVMARAREHAPIVQVGIRSIDASEVSGLNQDSVFFAEALARKPSDTWIPQIVNKLASHVYVTLDLDCFDPAIMPSTGTPEPGGMQWYDVLNLLESVAAERSVIGFDVVELLPNPNNPAPDFMAAKLVYEFLSFIFHGREKPAAAHSHSAS